MTELFIVPASPALVAELAPADAASERLRCAVRALGVAGPIDVVSSRAARWRTGLRGSLRAWGAPGVIVGGGDYLPELVVRYLLPQAEIRDARGVIGSLTRTTVVAVDGSAGLTPRAPLALRQDGAWAHEWCQALLRGERPALGVRYDAARLEAAGVIEPALWGELAALQPRRADLIDADATLGVGRYVARWEV